MIYLLDVNALLALGCVWHVHNLRVERWLVHLALRGCESVQLATCAITELGFVRIACGKAALLANIADARSELRRLKESRACIFLRDELGADRLPAWVKKPNQTTDGHLLELAKAHYAQLATLDAGIPGALLIPKEPAFEGGVQDAPRSYAMAWG